MFNNRNSYHTFNITLPEKKTMTTEGFKIAFVTFYYQPRYHKNHSGKQKNMKMAGLLTFLSSVGQMNQQTAVVVHPRVLHAHSQPWKNK